MNKFIVEENHLYLKISFKNFIEAFAFLSKVAIITEKANHHATIHNTYGIVELFLSTHDAGNTVTEKDWAVAKEIELLLE